MKNYWFISDTHFYHGNIIDYCNRPFSSVEEMNETLVQNWNRVVKQGDIVYHLGDVTMRHDWAFNSLWARLKGRKRLIVGNHDDVKYLSSGSFFDKVMLWRIWNDKNIVFSHVPLHQSVLGERKKRGPMINIHGHTHQNGSPSGSYKSVCVELTNYTPINLDELV